MTTKVGTYAETQVTVSIKMQTLQALSTVVSTAMAFKVKVMALSLSVQVTTLVITGALNLTLTHWKHHLVPSAKHLGHKVPFLQRP